MMTQANDPQPITILHWGRVRTAAERISPALRDKARGQCVTAMNAAIGRFPFIRVKFAYRKCYIYVLNRQYDLDKIRKSKLKMAMIFEASME